MGGAGHAAPESLPGMWIEPAEDDRWVVRDERRDIGALPQAALRLSVQWKARCYADAAEQGRTDALDWDGVIARLTADLRGRGVVTEDAPNETQLAIQMIQTYVRFPEAGLD